ncbi:Nramp family divalent metal transporter, partial [Actinophytocola sp.]|uniref:Nramp family divalent metal transporter n=1 Tax=Actinophytocola sp. TaxID=1872138 RepID=UPI00389B216A
GSLEGAHATLTPLLGGAASTLFAIALLASGLSSSAIGTLAGQVVMQGFINRRIPLFLRRRLPLVVRRLVTMTPALLLLGSGVDPTRALVLSQVVLSFGIPFALVPLVWLTRRRDVMGEFTNRRVTTLCGAAVAAVVSALNIFLLVRTVVG